MATPLTAESFAELKVIDSDTHWSNRRTCGRPGPRRPTATWCPR